MTADHKQAQISLFLKRGDIKVEFIKVLVSSRLHKNYLFFWLSVYFYKQYGIR